MDKSPHELAGFSAERLTKYLEPVPLPRQNTTPLTAQDLIGTMVPFDVTSASYLVGHHILCTKIKALANTPDYLVNGESLLPAKIVNEYLGYLENNAKAKADATRPQGAAWIAFKKRWYSVAWRRLLAAITPKRKAIE